MRVGPVGMLVILALVGGVAYAASKAPLGVIGPSTGIQPSGRLCDPEGRLTQLGNLPTGGALTPNGRFLWALSTGRGRNDVRIVQVAKTACKGGKKKGKKGSAGEAKQTGSKKCNRRAGKQVGRVVQTIPFPGLSGGIAMSPDGHTAYVSGLKDSSHTDEQVDPSVPGRQGDVIHVLTLRSEDRHRAARRALRRSATHDAPPVQNFPPNPTVHRSWPRDIAVSPERQDPAGRAQPRRRRGGHRYRHRQRPLRQRRPLPVRRRDHARRQVRDGHERDRRHCLR